jgi:tetratricopeptide (TPR) repeat protein
MNKIFISYSSKNADWVKTWLVPKLESHGVPAYVDYRDFEIGVPSVINMERAVEQCAKTILVFTPDWVNSEWAQFERLLLQTEYTTGLKKRILPLMLIDCKPPKRLGIFTYADFKNKNDWEAQLERLISQVQKDFAASATTAPHFPPLPADHIYMKNWPRTEFELFGRQQELARLDQAWKSAATNVISFVAFGGVGKTTLVNKWLEKMRWDNYRGSQKVFAWSFYSQGTNELVTSADVFINTALQWFGDQNPQVGTPWDKGKRLADLIRQQKTLLLLDGLEPLQSGHDFEKGKIKDAALSTLVTELAKSNNGLCVITTRENIAEIERYAARCEQINLEHISPEAGCALLRVRRVQGTDEELERLSGAFGNHALALTLLAEYLRQFEGHPAEKGFAIPDLEVPEAKGRHARRLMEAFAQQFSPASGTGTELELLQVLGLFNRPAPREAIARVMQAPAISGLTDRLAKLGEAEWLRLLHKLREVKLLAREYQHRPDTLDCHPLVREHFGEKLRQQNPAAWKEAHSRLYEYYKNLPAKHLPDTLEEMEPLFAAVVHGCRAGRHQEALDDVYWKRIKRGNEHYSMKKLGAFGADLSALSNFFEILWSQPASGLKENYKAFALSCTGFALRALGRLREAAQPMQVGLELRIKQEAWENAANAAGNLSELYLTLGEVSQAVAYARQSVDFADRSGDWEKQVTQRTALADALHQAGEVAESELLFREAEAKQKQRNPEYYYLSSLQGFQFCDLLMSHGQYQKVQKRAKQTLGWGILTQEYSLLDFALDKLSLGRAFMLHALAESADPSLRASTFTQARDYLQQAVAGLRKSGNQDELPRALFARAACYRAQNEFAPAEADLEEAREIAERGEMKLHLADYHLEACCLCLAQGEERRGKGEERGAKEHLAIAKEMIEKMGYGRRKPEVEALRREIEELKI